MLKKRLFFFLSILISGIFFSQQKNITISNLQPKSEDYVFPNISYKNNVLAEEKINTFLQLTELEYILNSDKNPFQLAKTATNSYKNFVYFYDWKRLYSPSNILSIYLNGEASGAYPEGFEKWVNFDIRNGNFINIEDLFTKTGKKTIESKITQDVRKTITDFLTELNKHKPENDAEKSDYETQKSMYEDCMSYLGESDFTYLKYYFEKDKLVFIRERCSNHALRALDDLDSFSIPFSYRDLQPYLSDYGKNLLSSSNQVLKVNSPKNKLYKGTIDNKYPIWLLVDNIYDDGSVKVTYWYEKTKKPIEWSGKIKGNHFSLTEDDYHDENLKQWIPRALIEADIKDNQIIGTWQDYKTKKYLNLKLEAY